MDAKQPDRPVRLPAHFSDDFVRQLAGDLHAIASELAPSRAQRALREARDVLVNALEVR